MIQKATRTTLWMMATVCWLGGAIGCTSSQTGSITFMEDRPHQLHSSDSDAPGTQNSNDANLVGIETEPSLQGLDRSHWPAISVQPVDGTTGHGHLLFKDVIIVDTQTGDAGAPQPVLDLSVMTLPAEDFSRVNKNAVEHIQQLNDALDGQYAQNWSGWNGLHALLQPLKMTADLAAIPLRPFVETVDEE